MSRVTNDATNVPGWRRAGVGCVFAVVGGLALGELATGGTPSLRPECDNQRDEDHDGLVDWGHDPGCGRRAFGIENPECQDGIDNDGDGAIDHPDDPHCYGPSDDREERTGCGLGYELALLLPLLRPLCARPRSRSVRRTPSDIR